VSRLWRSLTPRDHAILDGLLRREADMAYGRRLRILIDYLDLHDGERVFDVGCGMGFYLLAMGRLRTVSLVGLDGDGARLERAHRERVPARFVRGHLSQIPFAAASFDKGLMTEVLEHVEDDRGALCEAFRVLKPGGVLAISVPHARYPFLWDPINRVWALVGGRPLRRGPLVGIWTDHRRLYGPQDLRARVQDAGFQVDLVEEATHYSFPFMHFLLYGLGKPLIERHLLPRGVRQRADRFSAAGRQDRRRSALALGVALLRLCDRLNDRPAVAGKRTFVNVLVKARKPA
jgi:SAM-dependent methyltransferase